ncbi:DUF6377 domain-containing protein [Plebeiibacterium sediminum]|uniref:DUF6377 domain-containing protein n=1 Tax=Plebeiibacterium sediminum TaxID=2992112 RepID=A0AAE3M8F0_9BACT|nr:DUF6377 domain-containing protein [Plebeiobacterium sediminum]MCW3788887.1 DUF6377 domain-containing protein [Plebeiobacterium sediminum]
MPIRFITTLFTLLFLNQTWCFSQLPGPLLEEVKELEQFYAERKIFDTKKVTEINLLKEQILNFDGPDVEKYELYKQLYLLYFSFKNTEAYNCALSMQKLANSIKLEDLQIESQLFKADILLCSGLFNETFDVLNNIQLTKDIKYIGEYYKIKARLYGDLKIYNSLPDYNQQYTQLNERYADSLTMVVDSGSIDFMMAYTFKLKNKTAIKDAITRCEKILQDKNITLHEKAMLYSSMAWCAEQIDLPNDQIKYLLKSIEFDIKSSTYETTSSRVLAQLLLNEGEVELAHKFAVYAIEDAEFYGAIQRKAEITPIIPIIENQLLQLQQFKTRAILAISLFILLSLLVIFYMWIRLKKQHKKLQKAQLNIKENNDLLSQQNLKLSESNIIKEEYLTNYFELSTVYFHEMENMQNKIKSLLLQKKYTAIEKYLMASGPKEDKERMFERFDKLFLNLFPNFLPEVNKILTDPISEEDMNRLSSEMRVFALNRLGITNTDRIASILGVSRNTIYTYRNRIKSKSTLNPDAFDEYVVSINAN